MDINRALQMGMPGSRFDDFGSIGAVKWSGMRIA